jgi:hypothetical protein
MASHVLNDCAVYVNELDLTGQSNQVEATLTAEELDASVFGNSGYASTVAGLKTGTFNHTGFMEYTSGMDRVLLDAMGSTNVATVATDPALGAHAWLMTGASFEASPLSGSVGQLAALNGSIKSGEGSYGLRPGYIIANKAARTATASTTGVQLFTTGTVTLLTAALHVFTVSGSTPSCTVTVQSSATQGGSYTTRGTFTAATDETKQYISAAISTTEQWWRATFTISGSSPSFTAAVSAAVS